MNDPYLDENYCFERLWKDYEKHNSLVVAVDFDGVLFDLHDKGYKFPAIFELVKECWELGFKIVIFTAGAAERYPSMEKYLKDNKIPFDGINKNVINRNDGLDRTSSKIYYNIFLDDRAGMLSAYRILRRVVDTIKNGG